MKLAIAILNWNGLAHLQTFLPSVVEHSNEYPIFLIDNASTDGSVEWLKQAYPSIIPIVHEQNEGFCKGYNDGLSQIDSTYFVLLNSDVEVTEGWLDPILKILDNDASVAAVQPKILSYSEKHLFEYAGAGGGQIDFLGYPFCRGRIFDTLEEDKGQYDDITEIFWASGACFFVRTDLFRVMGGFDENFFAHMEEIDLCWRLKNAGYKIMYCGQSTVYHLGGGTLHKSNSMKTFLNYRNGLLLLYKNLPQKRLFSTLFLRLVLDGIAGVEHFLKCRFDSVKAIWRAHKALYSFIYLDKISRKNDSNFESPHILYKSIVWQYFIRGKKYYAELKKVK